MPIWSIRWPCRDKLVEEFMLHNYCILHAAGGVETIQDAWIRARLKSRGVFLRVLPSTASRSARSSNVAHAVEHLSQVIQSLWGTFSLSNWPEWNRHKVLAGALCARMLEFGAKWTGPCRTKCVGDILT